MDTVNHDLSKVHHKIIVDAALSGDQFAIKHISDLGNELGKGIAILVQILNPELVILGGRIAEAGKYLTVPIEQALQNTQIISLQQRMPFLEEILKRLDSLRTLFDSQTSRRTTGLFAGALRTP